MASFGPYEYQYGIPIDEQIELAQQFAGPEEDDPMWEDETSENSHPSQNGNEDGMLGSHLPSSNEDEIDIDDEDMWEDLHWPIQVYRTAPIPPARFEDLALLCNTVWVEDYEEALQTETQEFELNQLIFADLPACIDAHREWARSSVELGANADAVSLRTFFVLDDRFQSLADPMWIVCLGLRDVEGGGLPDGPEFRAIELPGRVAAQLFVGWPDDPMLDDPVEWESILTGDAAWG